jgi:membrane fusion protein, multidrug efflux system
MTRSQPSQNAPRNGQQNGRQSATLDTPDSSDLHAESPQAVQVSEETKPATADAPESEPEHKPSPLANMPKRRKYLLFAGLGIGLIAIGVFGFRWWRYASTHQDTDDAYVVGNIHPISSRVNGTVIAVQVNDNQQVKVGQVLVKLDPKDYQSQVQQAEAALAVARRQADTANTQIALSAQTTTGNTTEAQGNISSASAAIANAQAAVRESEAGIPAAQAQVDQAQANLQKAQADYDRYTTLYQQGAVTRQQLDNARNSYQVAVAQKNSAQEQVKQAQAKLAQSQEDVSKAQAQLTASQGGLQQAQAGQEQTQVSRNQYQAALAQIAQAQTKLRDAQLQLSYTTIVAPNAGVIGNKQVQLGQRVETGTPLMSVVDNQYWVTANFKETQLEQMQRGERVEIKLDTFPHHPFYGRVDSFAPASGSQFALLPPDNATGNFTKIVQRIPVKIVFDPQSIHGYEDRVTPGMSAVISVEVR